jgi:hypothetical protein
VDRAKEVLSSVIRETLKQGNGKNVEIPPKSNRDLSKYLWEKNKNLPPAHKK